MVRVQKGTCEEKSLRALLKMIHGVTPTQKHMKEVQLTMHAACPCCNRADEDIHHILNCDDRSHETEGIFVREIRKSYKDIQDQDHILSQILELARDSNNHMNSMWNLKHQTEIGWDLLLKGLVTKAWKEIAEKLVPDRNWKDTLSRIIVALCQTWLDMWKNCKCTIDYNTRYCTQVQDDNNKVSLQIFDTESNETEYTRTLKDAQGQNNRLVVNVLTNN